GLLLRVNPFSFLGLVFSPKPLPINKGASSSFFTSHSQIFISFIHHPPKVINL
ncbi:hypothetical protein LINPERHAP2_LOCUS38334, partial [Linum perenne]